MANSVSWESIKETGRVSNEKQFFYLVIGLY